MDNEIINQIQKVRDRNNSNWMALMRLAFKHAPDASKQIMRKIAKCDRKINELTRELIKDPNSPSKDEEESEI
jgi:hypothetical protein